MLMIEDKRTPEKRFEDEVCSLIELHGKDVTRELSAQLAIASFATTWSSEPEDVRDFAKSIGFGHLVRDSYEPIRTVYAHDDGYPRTSDLSPPEREKLDIRLANIRSAFVKANFA